jgi:phthiocerol/phenolphthiocerol synthesis type-I polyketide synthase C
MAAVIFYRSKHQEATRGLGTMAVLLAPVEEVEAFLVDYRRPWKA